MKCTVVLALALTSTAAADPLRLRADALASAQSPAGLLVLEADGTERPELGAEAVVWVGNAREDSRGDVLVIALRARTRDGRVSGRVGRFVSMLGALHPVHVDGGAGRVRLPHRFDAEVMAGIPVVPSLATGRGWDWVAGGRVARRLGDSGSVGLAYAQRRDEGRLDSEELGVDLGYAINTRNDLGARVAYDLVHTGLAEAGVTMRHVHKPVRTDLYILHRAASHLLPATSLFSVIGDVPSQRAGALVTWTAAPRLDVIADLGGRRVGSDYGAELVGRARLKLDDRGKSALTGELRRSGVAGTEWTGARAAARIALPGSLALATEIELVIPDEPDHRGGAWPWMLAACSWETVEWQAAVAVEASASPEYRHRVDVLFQVARRWGWP